MVLEKKGQTPKVDKQESKTGRAKRRMQYNMRFGVVVAAFGRRKGSNANLLLTLHDVIAMK